MKLGMLILGNCLIIVEKFLIFKFIFVRLDFKLSGPFKS